MCVDYSDVVKSSGDICLVFLWFVPINHLGLVVSLLLLFTYFAFHLAVHRGI